MAEGCGQELPPVRGAMPKVQAADPWGFTDVVRRKQNQIDEEQPEHAHS